VSMGKPFVVLLFSALSVPVFGQRVSWEFRGQTDLTL
jgi:hypothetical protein